MKKIERNIYETFVYIINRHRTWIKAELSPDLRPYIVVQNGQLLLNYSPAVILTVYRPNHGYKVNHKWIITEKQMEDAADRIKKEDASFWNRLTQNKLTLKDMELWVIRATYGFVNLELDEYELYFT